MGIRQFSSAQWRPKSSDASSHVVRIPVLWYDISHMLRRHEARVSSRRHIVCNLRKLVCDSSLYSFNGFYRACTYSLAVLRFIGPVGSTCG